PRQGSILYSLLTSSK
nr:Chain B, Nuclear receptor DAX1 [Homo sapiens]